MKVDYIPVTECFDIRTGKLNSNAAVDGGEYPFFTCSKEASSIDKYAFDQEALLLAGNNAQGQYDVKYYHGKFNAYQRTYVLSLKSDSHSYPYFKYALQAQLELLKASSKGTNTKYITMEILGRVLLPVPCPSEQKRIAAILDKADAIRQKRKQAIDLADEFLRSVFLDMFGDPVTNPKKWDVKTISDFCNVSSGSTPSRKREDYFQGSIPWVKTTEVDGYVIKDTEEKITELAVRDTSCKLNPRGAIVVAMYGQGKTRGKVGILGVEAATNQACAVLAPSNSINMSYLYYYLKLSYETLRSLGQGGGQPNLNGTIVKQFPILHPPKHLQDRFVDIVTVYESTALKNNTVTGCCIELFNSLSQSAFSGQL
ncbi:restriction endonuclease subunit S [Vibrio kagoshimensis]|uniref:restriction endonuclease subunit S n=1 Tax=Vibrio kagoshimensis TaxID=2910244 RepID=UPI003D1A56CB